MATTKKTPAKKAAPKKTTVKATSATKPVVKSKAVERAPAKKTNAKKQPAVQSFRVSREHQPFTSFRITRQTIYWIILVSFIIFVQLWILKLQIEVATLLDAQALQLQQL